MSFSVGQSMRQTPQPLRRLTERLKAWAAQRAMERYQRKYIGSAQHLAHCHVGPLGIGDALYLKGGDGDQEFLGEPKTLRVTEAPWFPGVVRGSAAILTRVEGGKFDGVFVALTARGPLSSLNSRGCGMVVLQLIDNPTDTFGRLEPDTHGVGIAYIERLREPPGEQS